MRKALHILSFAAVVLALLSSCTKEEFKENAIPSGEPIEVSINGQIGEFSPADATKATAESVVRVTWGSGDKVYVYDGSNASIGTLTVTPDENNASYAMLSGTITASAASPSKLTLVYVKGATEAPAIAGGKISVDLSNQNQDEVPFVLYAAVAYNAAALTKTNEYISFSFATSVMTVNCTGLQTGVSGAVEGIDKAEIDGVSTACELTIDGSGVTAVAGTTPGKITRTGTSVFTQSDSRGSFRFAIAADPAAPAARNILVHQGSKVSGAPFTSTTLAGGKSYNTVYQMGEYISNEPDGKLSGGFTVDAQGKKVYFSKGNLQATYNGSSYAWDFAANQYSCVGNAAGNTSIDSQTNGAVVDLFGWSTSSTTYGINTSNETSTYSGEFVDWGKAYCEKNSIAVGTWRTLSIEEWKYLFSYDESSYEGGQNYDNDSRRGKYKYGVTVCGKTNCVVLLPDNWQWDANTVGTDWQIEGYPETATVSNPVTWQKMEDAGAVCLPAAGNRDEDDVYNVGDFGYYWSSTATDYSDLVCPVHFSSGGGILNLADARHSGYSVRLVTESGGYSPAVKVTGVTICKEETSILVGGKEILAATVAPANATNKQVIWSSSKPSVATVDATSGEVTGVAAGSANIFATTADGNFKAVCLVTVKAWPAGALKGEFSVSATKKVYFSKGNLWADGSNVLHFEDAQWKSTPASDGSKDANHVSHFTWSDNVAVAVGGSNSGSNLFCDENNKQSVDGSDKIYYALSTAEWQYLFDTRTVNGGTKEGKSYQRATINSDATSVYGMILYPDNYTSQTDATSYTSTEWTTMEENGCVFLPATGYRNGSSVSSIGITGSGNYWSSTANDQNTAYRVRFKSDTVLPGNSSNRSPFGYSVRLITE